MNLEKGCQLVGWLLFVVCSGFYLMAGVQTQDRLIIWGSLLFLIACLVFMLPLMLQLLSHFSKQKDAPRD